MATMIAAIERLTEQVQEMGKRDSRANHRPNRGGPRYRPQSRHRSQSRQSQPAETSGICYYHRRYGSETRTCEGECNFAQKN